MKPEQRIVEFTEGERRFHLEFCDLYLEKWRQRYHNGKPCNFDTLAKAQKFAQETPMEDGFIIHEIVEM